MSANPEPYSITMYFDNGATVTIPLDDWDEDYVKEGAWIAPYPNTPEDSFIYGLLESSADPNNLLYNMLVEYGEPVACVVVRGGLNDVEATLGTLRGYGYGSGTHG